MITRPSRPAMVVDDVGSMTILLSEVLRVLGFREIDRVVDVETALNGLRSKRYGLVLSHIYMEPVDGFALLRKVRCDPTTSSLPFIFVSGQIRADFVERARMAGATGYIVKTSSPKRMIEIIRHALNGRPGDAFNVAHSLPSLETAEALIFGAEREPVH